MVALDIHGNYGIKDRYAPIKGELRNLGGREFTICLAKFHHSIKERGVIRIGSNTVVTGLRDGVVDRRRRLEMDSLGNDGVVGLLVGIRRKNILAQVLFLAEIVLDSIGVANLEFLFACECKIRMATYGRDGGRSIVPAWIRRPRRHRCSRSPSTRI